MQLISACWFCILEFTEFVISSNFFFFFAGVFRILSIHDHIICQQRQFYLFHSDLDVFHFFFLPFLDFQYYVEWEW